MASYGLHRCFSSRRKRTQKTFPGEGVGEKQASVASGPILLIWTLSLEREQEPNEMHPRSKLFLKS